MVASFGEVATFLGSLSVPIFTGQRSVPHASAALPDARSAINPKIVTRSILLNIIASQISLTEITAIEAAVGYAHPYRLAHFSRLVTRLRNARRSLSPEEVRSVQIETSRPISTTASTGNLKYSVRWAELRCMKANSASTNRGKAFSSSPGTTVSWPT
jgi:hypothetical protein